MLGPRTIRAWSWIHKWSSLVCTLVLLVQCISGVLLLFREEIDAGLGYKLEGSALPERPIDEIVAAGEAAHPDRVVQYVVWGEAPGYLLLSMGSSATSPPEKNLNVFVEAATGRVLDAAGADRGPMEAVLLLHQQLYLGQLGAVVLGLFSLIFVVAIVSGVVLYAPFMRRLAFGTIRREKSTRTRQLDLHNVLGITAAAWMLVIGGTGVINGWGRYIFEIWRMQELVSSTQPLQPDEQPVAASKVVETVRATYPTGDIYVIAYPGSLMASAGDYAVYVRGDTPQTEFLLKPALIGARTGALTAAPDAPWYIAGLLLSQPLHFGDYGGWPLRWIWAALTLVTIVLLIGGLYLWLTKRRRVTEAVAE